MCVWIYMTMYTALNELADVSEEEWFHLASLGRRRLMMPFESPQDTHTPAHNQHPPTHSHIHYGVHHPPSPSLSSTFQASTSSATALNSKNKTPRPHVPSAPLERRKEGFQDGVLGVYICMYVYSYTEGYQDGVLGVGVNVYILIYMYTHTHTQVWE